MEQNNPLTTVSPSFPTAYYATGMWLEEMNLNQSLKETYFTVSEREETIKFNGPVQITNNCAHAVFRALPENGPDQSKAPLSINNYYWQQAPLSPFGKNRLPNVTVHSGKFLVFIEADRLNAVWERFKAAYSERDLGCYGIQCSTSLTSPHARSESKLITLHVEDSFDLHNVAKVAWEIHKIVADDISKRGLSYMTDRTTVTYSGKGCAEEGDPLYLFPATCFSDRTGLVKSLEAFTSTFIYIATQFAQKRQQILRDVQEETFFNGKTVIEDVRELNTNQIANFFAQESQKILKEAFERRKNNHFDSDDSSDEEIDSFAALLRSQEQARLEQAKRIRFLGNLGNSSESSDEDFYFSRGGGYNSDSDSGDDYFYN